MFKEKLFKWLFPTKVQYIELLKKEIELHKAINEEIEKQNILLPLDFVNLDSDDNPIHYFHNLSEEARKMFIAKLESIYSDDEFQKVVTYVINVIANYSFQKQPDESRMREGRYAVVGVRTLMNELEKAHTEYLNSRQKPEEFDDLEIMPE